MNRNPIILLIEDHTDIRENVAELLMLEGYEVLSAQDGMEALAIVSGTLPDIVICDVVMPGLSGYEVFEELQNSPRTMLVPFILATAQSEKADLLKAQAKGIRHYLVKPYDERDLLRCILRCFSSAQ